MTTGDEPPTRGDAGGDSTPGGRDPAETADRGRKWVANHLAGERANTISAAAQLEALRRRAEDINSRLATTPKLDPREDYTNKKNAVDIEDREAVLKLKKLLAKGAFLAVAIQLGIADLAFIIYAFAQGWNIPEAVMIGWLSATVVQTVGIVLVIARHLFPHSSRDE